MIGLTEGVSQYSEEPWLKFSYLGKVEFIAKKHYRIKVSSHALYSAGAMLGRRSIKINGKVYKVRLMKGKNEGSQDDSSSYRGSIVMRSEWNRLMYPIYETQYFYNNQYKYNVSETDPPEHWGVNYKNDDLNLWRSTLCQDTGYYYRGSDERIDAGIYVRGGSNCIDESYYREEDGPYFNWRPVLELIN